MLTCLAKISLPACGRRCVLELKKAVLGVQSGVQAILRAVRRFSSDFGGHFWLCFLDCRLISDAAVQCHWSGVTGGGSPPPKCWKHVTCTCWMLIAIRNATSNLFWDEGTRVANVCLRRVKSLKRRVPRVEAPPHTCI